MNHIRERYHVLCRELGDLEIQKTKILERQDAIKNELSAANYALIHFDSWKKDQDKLETLKQEQKNLQKKAK